MRWNYAPVPAENVAALVTRLGVDPVVAELLLRVGHVEDGPAGQFLRPSLSALGDPFLLVNLGAAVDRLRRALLGREKIVVLGDYDVDGVSSTTLLVGILRRLGLDPRYVVPRRLHDGYGLSRSAIDRALEQGKPDLFIALDCGTNSHEEVAYLRTLDIDVIVIDHHRSKELPRLDAVLVNPHALSAEDDAAWHHLCTVGLVFKLVHGLLKRLRLENYPGAHDIRLKDYLDLVAMGTVADLVPLTGENRILARHGLHILETTQRPGLLALMDIAGIKRGQSVQPVDISFRLGPRINASGRLADAALSVDLLLSDSPEFCLAAARQLDAMNRERQDIEREITEQAERLVEERYASANSLVLFDESWHPGVVGIVAGRISRKYNRPCIVLGNEGDLAKGSGRGISGLNLVDLLTSCAPYLESWGGHPMAVGVSLRKGLLAEFRIKFEEVICAARGGAAKDPALEISAWLDGTQITEQLMEGLGEMHPYGQSNPEPVFGVSGLRLRQTPEIFKDQHFRFYAEDRRGRRISGVAWKFAHRLPPVGPPLEFAVELNWNYHNGRRSLQMELVDWRLEEAPALRQNSA
ncbi:MAG: single-stranded-DNA-specific exonuclease RecJ [Opitutaceae bacterium]|nr:single-stranded-DNA-specific exonuclease RecJ [Opitutaceae bacterium]